MSVHVSNEYQFASILSGREIIGNLGAVRVPQIAIYSY